MKDDTSSNVEAAAHRAYEAGDPAPVAIPPGFANRQFPVTDELHNVALTICGLCINGEGGECHTPGCAFWMNRAPDLPLTYHINMDCNCPVGFGSVASPDCPLHPQAKHTITGPEGIVG